MYTADDAKRDLRLSFLAVGLGEPVTEYRFSPPRRWRFDYAWPPLMLAVEFEGGAYSSGRHVRGRGFESDAEKYNEAALLGWRVLRYTTGMVRSGLATKQLENWSVRNAND